LLLPESGSSLSAVLAIAAFKPSAMVKLFRPILKELESDMSRKLGQNVDIRMQIAKD